MEKASLEHLEQRKGLWEQKHQPLDGLKEGEVTLPCSSRKRRKFTMMVSTQEAKEVWLSRERPKLPEKQGDPSLLFLYREIELME